MTIVVAALLLLGAIGALAELLPTIIPLLFPLILLVIIYRLLLNR